MYKDRLNLLLLRAHDACTLHNFYLRIVMFHAWCDDNLCDIDFCSVCLTHIDCQKFKDFRFMIWSRCLQAVIGNSKGVE